MTDTYAPLTGKITGDVSLAHAEASLRRCLVSGESKSKSELVRFVAGPDGVVVPDLAEKLPGRGMWVSADSNLIAQAVQKNLFSKSAKKKLTAKADLLGQVNDLLARRCRDLLGLARAAGAVIAREKLVQDAILTASVESVILASDAGKDITKRLATRSLGDVTLFTDLMTRQDLSDALGRENCAVVALRLHPLTILLTQELVRWRNVGLQITNGSSD